jgi:hypothetical protein
MLGFSDYGTLQKWEYGTVPVPELVSRVLRIIETMEEKDQVDFLEKLSGFGMDNKEKKKVDKNSKTSTLLLKKN